MDNLVSLLRAGAQVIADQGGFVWGNLMTSAAERIEELEEQNKNNAMMLTQIEDELAQKLDVAYQNGHMDGYSEGYMCGRKDERGVAK